MEMLRGNAYIVRIYSANIARNILHYCIQQQKARHHVFIWILAGTTKNWTLFISITNLSPVGLTLFTTLEKGLFVLSIHIQEA